MLRAPVIGVVLLALGVRLAALVAAHDATLLLDERAYLARAEALLDGQGFVGSYQSWVRHPDARQLADLPQYPGAWQPPLYTIFIAAVLGASGGSLLAVKLAQVVLSAATVGFVHALGTAWLGRQRALVAAAICALYPELIAFSHYLWSETLFIFLFVLGVWLLTRKPGLPTALTSVVAGGVLGLGALTRSALFSFLPLLVIWLVASHREDRRTALRRAALLFAAAVVVIAPWSVRNTRGHGGFVWLDTSHAFNLWRGHAASSFAVRPAAPEASYAPPFESIPLLPVGPQDPRSFVEAVQRDLGRPDPTDLEIARRGRALAWAEIRRAPSEFFARAWYKLIDLWNPTSFLLRHFRLGAYGPVPPLVEGLISWLAVSSYLLLVGCAGLGLLEHRDRHAGLVLLLAGWISALAVIGFGLTRFRLPLVPFLALFAAHSIVRGWSRRWRMVEPEPEV